MKRIIVYFTLILLGLTGAAVPIEKAAAQGMEVSFQVFYNQLNPYGHWVDFPDEGYVWIPSAEQDFSPYSTRGYWVNTNDGWMWVSDYQWGWAPFHYGRWDFDDDYGWYWVPGYEWAPAWVAWSRSPGYYGWAPLRPGIDPDEAITGYYVPTEHWCYVHEEYLGHRDMDRHYAPRSENPTHIRNSTMIGRTYEDNSHHRSFLGGPEREDVAKSTGAPVVPVTVRQRSTPGQSVANNQVSIYHPTISKTTARDPHPAPPSVTNLRDVKPLPGRTPSPERLNAAPQAPVQTRATPPSAVIPPNRPNDRANSQQPQQTNRAPEPQRQTPPSQQAPPPIRASTPEAKQQVPEQQGRQNQNAPPAQAAPTRQRAPRYAPPQYQSPRSNGQPQQSAPQPKPEPPHQQQQAPQQQAPPPKPEPPHQAPQQQAPPAKQEQPHQEQPQNGHGHEKPPNQ